MDKKITLLRPKQKGVVETISLILIGVTLLGSFIATNYLSKQQFSTGSRASGSCPSSVGSVRSIGHCPSACNGNCSTCTLSVPNSGNTPAHVEQWKGCNPSSPTATPKPPSSTPKPAASSTPVPKTPTPQSATPTPPQPSQSGGSNLPQCSAGRFADASPSTCYNNGCKPASCEKCTAPNGTFYACYASSPTSAPSTPTPTPGQGTCNAYPYNNRNTAIGICGSSTNLETCTYQANNWYRCKNVTPTPIPASGTSPECTGLTNGTGTKCNATTQLQFYCENGKNLGSGGGKCCNNSLASQHVNNDCTQALSSTAATPTPTPANSGAAPSDAYDPTASANDSAIQNACGANPNDPKCCRINEWKNQNQGTSLPTCAQLSGQSSSSSGGTGGTGTIATGCFHIVASTSISSDNKCNIDARMVSDGSDGHFYFYANGRETILNQAWDKSFGDYTLSPQYTGSPFELGARVDLMGKLTSVQQPECLNTTSSLQVTCPGGTQPTSPPAQQAQPTTPPTQPTSTPSSNVPVPTATVAPVQQTTTTQSVTYSAPNCNQISPEHRSYVPGC